MATETTKEESKILPTKKITRLSIQEVLYYEIHSNWIAGWIGFEWGQDLMATYIAWKVKRKYNRYLVSLEMFKHISNKL